MIFFSFQRICGSVFVELKMFKLGSRVFLFDVNQIRPPGYCDDKQDPERRTSTASNCNKYDKMSHG